ncbi:hypothetical protein J6590_011689 [Homalodisca vitripennis]|nr:hypothetical protein J6590_011689 [Homalodisca vitripennis]
MMATRHVIATTARNVASTARNNALTEEPPSATPATLDNHPPTASLSAIERVSRGKQTDQSRLPILTPVDRHAHNHLPSGESKILPFEPVAGLVV